MRPLSNPPLFCDRLCALPKLVAPVIAWSAPWRPLLFHLGLLLLYVWLVREGALLYRAGIEFSYGGSSFGQQIACVAASAACLIAASITAGSTDEVALRWPTRATAADAAQARREKQQEDEAKGLHDSTSNPLLEQGGGANVADEPTPDQADAAHHQKMYGAKTVMTLCYPRLRGWILIPLPLCVPLLLSIRAFSSNTATNTALSAEINIILFRSIGMAVGLVLGMLYMACVQRRGQVVIKVAGPIFAATLLYLFVNYLQAQTAYLHGVVTPSFLLDPNLRLDGPTTSPSALWDANPYLAGRLHNDYALAGFASPPPPSVLDSLPELRRRKEWSHCRIEPHWHLADVLPRRSSNFFVGSDSCPSHRIFAQWDRVTNELVVKCPTSAGDLEIDFSPDWIARRTLIRPASNLNRHHALFVMPESKARASALDALSTSLAFPSLLPTAAAAAPGSTPVAVRPSETSARFPTGTHSWMSARCGSHENYFVGHVPDPAITERARSIMRSTLFPREYEENAQQRIHGTGDKPAKEDDSPDADSDRATTSALPDPLLLNPPVLMLFVDCVSRSHMMRSLPLTIQVLRKAQHASSAPRAARERVYESQQSKQALRKRHRKARDARRDPDKRQTTQAASDQAELDHAAEERQFMAEMKAQDRLIRGTIRQAKATLDATQPLPSGASSTLASPRTPYTVYESSLYHVVDHHTRGNMQAMLCASGLSGWGGSLVESKRAAAFVAGDATEPGAGATSARAFVGRGQQLPPRYTPGHIDFVCPARDLIWNRYKSMGYVTATLLNECSDIVNDLFGSSAGKEFSADYEVVAPFCHSDYDHAGVWSNFAGPFSMRRRCMAGRYVHEYTIDWARDFIRTYDSRNSPPWFLFLSFVEAHEGSLAVLALIDAALVEFLEWLLTSLAVPPIILLLSDHGSHMGPFTEFTRGGDVEHKLPALFTLVPEPWIAYWDVTHKAQALDAFESGELVRNAGTVAKDATYFTLHTDITSKHPMSAFPLALMDIAVVQSKALPSSQLYAPAVAAAVAATLMQSPFAADAPSVRQSSLLDSSIGLSLHQNRWSLVTAREIYWFMRGIPARVASDPSLHADRAREAKWIQARQRDAETNVKEMALMLRRDPQGGAFLSPRRAQSLAFHALAALLNLDVDAFVRLTRACSNSSAVVGPYGDAVEGAVVVRETQPLSLSSYIVADRRCDQSGILDSLCICNKGEN